MIRLGFNKALCRHFTAVSPKQLIKAGDIYRLRRIIGKEDIDNMMALSSMFASKTAPLPTRDTIAQTIVGSLFSSLMASKAPQAIYVKQQINFNKDIKEEDEIEVYIKVKTLKKARSGGYMTTLETKILRNDYQGKSEEAATGEAMVKVQESSVNI